MSFIEDLEQNGYAIVENILTPEEVSYALDEFRSWLNSYDQIKKIHNKVSPHGIFKHFEAGHQRHSWFIRTRGSVQDVFKKLWNTEELVVSFDGNCWIDEKTVKKDNAWTHTDQAPDKRGLKCYQGFVSLTENKERTLIVYEGSHKLHETYMASRNITGNKDWQLIDYNYLEEIKDMKKNATCKSRFISIMGFSNVSSKPVW